MINRKQRRTQAATVRKAKASNHNGKSNGSLTANPNRPATVAELQSLVTNLNETFTKLAETLNNNNALVKRSLELNDNHLSVSRRIMNDIARGSARYTPMHPNDVAWLAGDKPDWETEKKYCWLYVDGAIIDYEWYYQQYAFAQYVIFFFNWMLDFCKPEAPVEMKLEEPRIIPASDTSDMVFGGDYGVPG